jgi:hypothetical protein
MGNATWFKYSPEYSPLNFLSELDWLLVFGRANMALPLNKGPAVPSIPVAQIMEFVNFRKSRLDKDLISESLDCFSGMNKIIMN